MFIYILARNEANYILFNPRKITEGTEILFIKLTTVLCLKGEQFKLNITLFIDLRTKWVALKKAAEFRVLLPNSDRSEKNHLA